MRYNYFINFYHGNQKDKLRKYIVFYIRANQNHFGYRQIGGWSVAIGHPVGRRHGREYSIEKYNNLQIKFLSWINDVFIILARTQTEILVSILALLMKKPAYLISWQTGWREILPESRGRQKSKAQLVSLERICSSPCAAVLHGWGGRRSHLQPRPG